MDYAQLSVEELHHKKLEIARQQQEVERIMTQRLREGLSDFVLELHGRISSRGYEVEEIAQLLMGRTGRTDRTDRTDRRRIGWQVQTPTGNYYIDPDNPAHTYKRGPLPRWLRERMLAQGYDPEDKQSRENFKAEHLRWVEI